MDPARADVDSVHGEPEGATALAQPLTVAHLSVAFGGGEDVGAYEGGVLAPEEVWAGRWGG
ncbi:hypothetical protein [Streptomyces bluensis]|uniref:Uncharacterized protein n=1 Tax=Streptomyces bluensis TaxID=33897 RepID=A0ABW6UUI8_9ACTN